MAKAFISDADMEKLEASQPKKKAFISDEEMSALESKEAPMKAAPEAGFDWSSPYSSVLKGAAKAGVKGLQAVGQFADRYTGAPTRAGLLAGIKGENPLTAAKSQFGEDGAPTGAQIAEELGVPSTALSDVLPSAYSKTGEGVLLQKGGLLDPTASGAVGLGIDVLADPTNLIPFGSKAVRKGISKLDEILPKGGLLNQKQAIGAAQEQLAEAGAKASAKGSASISGGDISLEQGGELFGIKAPQSLEELRNWTPKSGDSDLVAAGRLREIEARVPELEVKPLKYHYDMLSNPKAMKEYKLRFENLPTEDAQKIAAYNLGMVNEAGEKIEQIMGQISKTAPRELSEAGDDFIKSVKDVYKSEKESLGPVFESFKTNARTAGSDETRDFAIAIGENTKLGKLMKIDPKSGNISMLKNAPRSGLSDSEYGILSRVIEDMNKGMTFKEIQDTRDFLRKAIDPANPGATEEISKVRSLLLGQLETMASKQGEEVTDIFRQYAKNERNRESIEKIIGGKVESLDAMFSANPDRVVKKIFSNPNYVKIIDDYVGTDKVNELIASYVNTGVRQSFDSVGGFNPSKMRNWLKTNKQFISNYVDPSVAEKMSALADYGYLGKRFLDEVNPSGTAASLAAALEPKKLSQKFRQGGILGTVTSEAAGLLESKLSQKQAIKAVNEMLGETVKPGAKFSDLASPAKGLLGDERTYIGLPKAGLLEPESERRKRNKERNNGK